MMLFNLLNLFSPTQLIILCIIVFVAIAIIVGNFLLRWYFKKNMKRQLCTKQLQDKREKLLADLDSLKSVVRFTENENHELVETLVEEDEDIVEAIDNQLTLEEEEPLDPFRQLQILKVRDMSYLLREKNNLLDRAYDRKSFYVRYSYSFEAKLRASEDHVKGFYKELIEEISTYKGLNYSISSKHVRIYKGLKTLSFLEFRGKTLCMAFALDPDQYKDTKYRGKDMSHIKKYAATPMLLKITSKNKKEYAKYLILQLAENNSIPLNPNPKPFEQDLSLMKLMELYEHNLVQVSIYTMVEAEDEAFEVEEEREENLLDLEEDTVEGEIEDEDEETEEEHPQKTPFAFQPVLGKDLSSNIRRKYGILDSIYDEEEFHVRYSYSFEAKLRQSDDSVKQFLKEILEEISKYKGLNYSLSSKRIRVNKGFKTMAILTFRGKKLSIALALDPAYYENTKYRGKDVSHIKKYAQTPMLLKISSPTKKEYAKYLIQQLAQINKIPFNKKQKEIDVDWDYMSDEALIEAGLIQVLIYDLETKKSKTLPAMAE